MQNERKMRGRKMVARVFLAVLGVLNLWVSAVIWAAHPVLAAVNAAASLTTCSCDA